MQIKGGAYLRLIVRLDSVKGQNIVNKLKQIFRRHPSLTAAVLLLFKVADVAVGNLDHSEYCIYRRPYIMAHAAQKVGFRFICTHLAAHCLLKAALILHFCFFLLVYIFGDKQKRIKVAVFAVPFGDYYIVQPFSVNAEVFNFYIIPAFEPLPQC